MCLVRHQIKNGYKYSKNYFLKLAAETAPDVSNGGNLCAPPMNVEWSDNG
jgi:hypothetical protein